MVPPPVMGGGGYRPRARGAGSSKAGEAPQRPAAPAPSAAKKRVLFVCIGNSCRSQMAEAFAKAYGSDIMEVHSAGLSPATMIAPLTRQVLSEHNLNIDGHFPKGMEMLGGKRFDVVVNMSGHPAPMPGVQIVTWPVQDPIGKSDAVYRTVATQIEGLVMRLILEMRGGPGARR